jgi:prepilin-type N-terminal cleavage/methylation domain-containing protein
MIQEDTARMQEERERAAMNKQTEGFTLVEILITAAIIGLVALMALPQVLRSWHHAQAKRFSSDLRIVAGAADSYATENGTFPTNHPPGVAPSGLDPYLKRFEWDRPPIGGVWDWEANSQGVIAGISVFDPSVNVRTMEEVDRTVDDGDLESGFFRFRADGRGYMLALAE